MDGSIPGAALMLFGLSLFGWNPAQLGAAYLSMQIENPPAAYNVTIDRHVTMVATDGTELVADIYHPQELDKPPTILVRLPYSDTLYNRVAATAVGTFWAERGYTVVLQGTRGRFDSGGDYYPLWYEREEGSDTLAWLKTQSWFDGRLALWGGSYFGYTEWAVSDHKDPTPSAMMVSLASTDFHGMFYPGGAFSLESALYWANESQGRLDVEPDPDALDRGYAGFPLIDAAKRAGNDVNFFRDWVNHPTRDWYWRHVDGDNRASEVHCPVYFMAGWSDPFLPSELRDYEELTSNASRTVAAQSHLVIGPWAHAHTVELPDGSTPGNYRTGSIAPAIPWFDQLFSLPGAGSFPPVRVFVMGRNQWRDESEWPLQRTQFTPFYLHGKNAANGTVNGGYLSTVPPQDHEPADHFTYDPNHPAPSAGGAMLGPNAGYQLQNDIERRSDVLIYSTPPLDRDTEVTGPVKAILFVTSDAPNTDFTAKLVDVHPDGTAYNVCDGILRRSYESADRVERVEIELWPTSMVFMQGHRIRLEVSSSNYPRYDRNPNTGRGIATETTPRLAHQSVYHAAATPSEIILPIIPPSA